ncbi:hypothetical protein HYY75_03510, partial [bacterium]|nr:hypothetical protein [bacterium]
MRKPLYFFCKFFLLFFFFLSLSTGILSASKDSEPAPLTVSDNSVTAQYSISLTRIGGFLKDSNKEPLEIMRRLGRFVKKLESSFQGEVLEVAGFSSSSGSSTHRPLHPVFAQEWSSEEKNSVGSLSARSKDTLSALAAEIPTFNSCLKIQGFLDPIKIADQVELFLKDPEKLKKLKFNQVSKLKENILPLLKIADQVVLYGIVSNDGFNLKVKFVGNQFFKEFSTTMGFGLPVPPCGKFLEPESLISVCQHETPSDPQKTMEN